MKNNNNLLGSASTAVMRQFLHAARDYCIEPEDALEACRLPSGVLDNQISRTTGSDLQSLLRWLIEKSGDPLFGLHSAKHVQPGAYSLVGYMAMNSRTAREALMIVPRYEALIGDMGVTKIERRNGNMLMHWICHYTDPVVRPQLIDNVVASWVYFARWLTEMPEGKPLEVFIEHAAPSDRLRVEYEEIFQAPVTFNAPINGIVVCDSILDLKLRQPDPALLSALEHHAASLTSELQSSNSLVVQARSILLSMMQSGLPRRDRVAEQLGMAERTLQRRLGEVGTSYQQLLDSLRHEMSMEWLTHSDLSISDISDRLGFSEARSFQRRFKAWTGITPGEFRRAHHGQAAEAKHRSVSPADTENTTEKEEQLDA
jgi:AraC-like DNA-binding protein